MTNKVFLDSNIWLYMLITDQNNPEEVRKQELARQLTENPNNTMVISTQVIAEVSVNLIKKLKISEDEVRNLIQDFYDSCIVVEINYNILINSSQLRSQYMLSFWDSLIVASALSIDTNILYSEDMQNGLMIDKKLQIINPFLE
jgi:predicted nucleic acid-binding protein